MGYFVFAALIVIVGIAGVVIGGLMSTEKTDMRGNVIGKSNTGRLVQLGSAIAAVVVFLLVTAFASTDTVNNGNIGIVKQFGNLVGTTGSGLVTHAPWQSVSAVSVRNELRTYEMDQSNAAVSSDSQAVYLTVQVNYNLERDKAVDLYRKTGGDYINRILDPAVYQYTKEVTAEYRATDFAANRETIRQKIEARLNLAMQKQGININSVTIKNVDFTPDLKAAIERTVEAKQNAKQAQAQVQVAQAQAAQKVATAKGDAEAQKLRRSTLTPELLQQEAIQALNSTDKTIIICQNGVCPSILPLTGATK